MKTKIWALPHICDVLHAFAGRAGLKEDKFNKKTLHLVEHTEGILWSFYGQAVNESSCIQQEEA